MADLITFTIDRKGGQRVKDMLDRLAQLDTKYEKSIRKALRNAVKIWADHINKVIYNRGIEQRTGKLGRAFGVGTFKSERYGYIGGKSRPKKAAKTNGGWYAHFFARPARQMGPEKKFPFHREYRTKTSKVISAFKKELYKVLREAGGYI